MDFAPYQDTDPERTRALSPPPPNHRTASQTSRNATKSPPPASSQKTNARDPYASGPLPAPNHFNDDSYQASGYQGGYTASDGGGGGGGGVGARDVEAGGGRFGVDVNLFETSLPLRLDYEAMLAYLLLPPAGGVFLLVIEHKSDYVRFHAWQSSLVFSAIFVIHLIFSWSSILSWMLFAVDLCLIAFLAYRAYIDAMALDRFEMPFFGGLASSFVDAE